MPRVHQGARFCTARDISAHGVGFVRRRQRWQGRGFCVEPLPPLPPAPVILSECRFFCFLSLLKFLYCPAPPGIAIIAGVTFRRKTMGNFKRDSAGGKAAGQMCEGNGNRGGSRNGSRDEALHAVTPGRYVDLTLDAGFKAVFADRGNKELLIGLLNVLLPPEARVGDILEYLDRETGPDFLGGKSTRMDLVCRGEDGRRFIVEMQREPETAFFERCVYYGSGVYRAGLPRGGRYGDWLHPVYVVGILNYSLPHDDESLWDSGNMVSCYRFIESRTGELAPDTILCIFAELGRFGKSAAECADDRDALFWLFRHSGVMDSLPEELRHSRLAEGITDACELAGFPADKKTLYEKDMITELDMVLRNDYARKEGKAEGKAEEQSAIARRMLEDNVPVEVIAKYSGLSEDEVRKLM